MPETQGGVTVWTVQVCVDYLLVIRQLPAPIKGLLKQVGPLLLPCFVPGPCPSSACQRCHPLAAQSVLLHLPARFASGAGMQCTRRYGRAGVG